MHSFSYCQLIICVLGSSSTCSHCNHCFTETSECEGEIDSTLSHKLAEYSEEHVNDKKSEMYHDEKESDDYSEEV